MNEIDRVRAALLDLCLVCVFGPVGLISNRACACECAGAALSLVSRGCFFSSR